MSKIFTVLVVGDNPEELMKKYDLNEKVERYVKYKYLDAEKMKNNNIKIIENIISKPNEFGFTEFQLDFFKDKLKYLKDMSSFEFYKHITNGLFYDENGDALSDENPNGKWKSYKLGDYASLPLITKDNNNVHQSINSNIDWKKMHMQNTYTYEVIWDMIKEGKEPQNDIEKNLFNNMSGKDNYFSKFKSKDEYVIHNCAYWNYAYLDANGWQDIDDSGLRDIEWVSTYYDKFITKLQPNDKITIFECSK